MRITEEQYEKIKHILPKQRGNVLRYSQKDGQENRCIKLKELHLRK